MTAIELEPSYRELVRNSVLRHGKTRSVGPIIHCRRRVGYFTAEEFYELTVSRMVHDRMSWLDVGCGRDLLPMNPQLAQSLSKRCGRLVGVDPDPNVLENRFVHERVQLPIEQFASSEPFDLITLRMVVEHIEDPQACVDALKRNSRSKSVIVIYTPHKYSLTSIVAALTPNQMHHTFKNRLWHTEERDTFPTFYRMNTIRSLCRTLARGGFVPHFVRSIDDAALFHACPHFGQIELYSWRILRRLRLGYPESNILAVFVRD